VEGVGGGRRGRGRRWWRDGCRALLGLGHGLKGTVDVGEVGAPLHQRRQSFVQQGPCRFPPGTMLPST